MTIKKSTLNLIKNSVILFGISAIIVLGLIVLVSNRPASTTVSTSNVSTDTSGNQVIRIDAKNGYTPKLSEAKAGSPVTLRVSTKNTFDCSTALTIPSLRISKNLPFNGETDIEIPAQTAGTVLTATCSMGMYSFQIRFT